MSMNLIQISDLSITEQSFQDPRLQKATARILSIYHDAAKYADRKNREIAKILATVKDEKSYEADGFSSVGDYAGKVFGISSVNAYKLATAGAVYNNPDAPEIMKQFSPSKLAELSRVPEEALKSAIDSQTITPDTTQKELREFARQNAPAKIKIAAPVKIYALTIMPQECVSTTAIQMTADFTGTMGECENYVYNRFFSAALPEDMEVLKCSSEEIEVNTSDGLVTKKIMRRAYICNGCGVLAYLRETLPPSAYEDIESIEVEPVPVDDEEDD